VQFIPDPFVEQIELSLELLDNTFADKTKGSGVIGKDHHVDGHLLFSF